MRITAALGVAMVTCATATVAPAQPLLRGNVQLGGDEWTADGELAQNVFVPPQRRIVLQLAGARKLLEAGRYGDAVRALGSVLDGPEDYFFQPDKQVPIHRSLKTEAQRLIGQMPREGRELYELEYGSRARQRLTEALSKGDADGLAEASRRFFHTQSGYEATLLLGLDHLDHSRPLAGALSLQRLRAAGAGAEQFEPVLSLALATCWLHAESPEKARDVLSALKERVGSTATIEIAGKPVAWFAGDAEAVEWLAGLIGPLHADGPTEAESWVMFRGNPSRNATTAASAPLLNMRWRIPTTDDPLLEAKLCRDRQIYLDRGIPALPGLHPLVVHKEFALPRRNKPPLHVEAVVLMRTFRNLLAVDFMTGKRLWEVPVDDPLEVLLGSNALQAGTSNSSRIAAGVAHRVWDDTTYGTMSSDGRCVFTVEDLSVAISTNSSQRTVIINGRRVSQPAQRSHNRLAAHDIRTGKLIWNLGASSQPSDGGPALRLADTFFLGPPLPLMGRLYVLGEVKGEVRLFALDADTGALVWSQQLALVEGDILQSPIRRLAGASPSYADGILVCPTCAGAVVAVDLSTRSLLWGYRYGRYANSSRSARAQMMALRMGRYPTSQPQNRWFDTAVVVADGRVLVTPTESDSLHCLNLIDGDLRWKYRRDDDLFVACVHRDNVVLVGRRQVRAVSLSETVKSTEQVQTMERSGNRMSTVTKEQVVVRPKPAWDGRTVSLPEGSMPSGRGFSSSGKYFLPLSSAEVLAIDLVAGKTLQVSRSRKGNVPGNLVCYKGKVISQGVDGLEVFAQLDAVRREVDQRLAAKPDDPVALALRGEILLDEGKQSEAIASFRQAYDLDPDPRTRSLLRDALLDGLRLQFAAHRDRAEEIEQLLDEPGGRATYLRLMATGLQASGEWRAALDYYVKLIDLDQDHRVMEPVAKALSVRLDRLIRAQFAELRREAKDEVEVIDRTIEARLQAALEADNTDALRRFLDYFGDHPIAGKARHELIRRLGDSGRWLEAELVLWQQQQSSDRAVVGAAVAELAELLRRAKRPEDAALCYRRLHREFADVACLDGKTGKQLLNALPADGPVAEVLRQDDSWPVGKVEKRELSNTPQTANYPRFTMPYRGSLAPFFSETVIRLDQSRRVASSHDGLGKKQWELSLVQAGRSLPFNYTLTHARVCGHLLLLSLGNRIMAVDTLGFAGPGQPKLLWSQDLDDPAFEVAGNVQQIAFQQIAAVHRFGGWGFGGPFGMGPAFSPTGYSKGRPGGLGPVTAGYTCFQRYRDLIAADPMTGKVLWIRRGTVAGSTLFGDDRFLFAAAPNTTEATVFRALDGKLLGKRKVPRFTAATQILPGGTTHTTPSSSGESCIAILGRELLVWNIKDGQASLGRFDPWQQRQVWPARKFSTGAKFDMAGQEAIGVLEPGGRFVLIGLADGRMIADVKLERERNVSSVCVFRSGEQYVLVTIDSAPQNDPNRVIQVLPGNLSKAIGRGRVYSFDMEGKLLWPEAVQIKDQHLLLNQPGRLPVLTFACGVYNRTQRSSARHQVSVLCIDKRTGRIAYEGSFPYTTSTFGLTGDPQANSVDLQLSRKRVTLTFTDQPIPPPAEPQAAGDLPTKFSDVARGLFRAIGKAVRDGGSIPPRPPNRPAPARPR
jgi:outer membrane protein assembly factor BamB/tetratricopeptide (TPR) repeat protein